MQKIISFGTAAVLALAAIATWGVATTHSNHHANLSAASGGSQITPFDLMRNSKDAPHQQYDAH